MLLSILLTAIVIPTHGMPQKEVSRSQDDKTRKITFPHLDECKVLTNECKPVKSICYLNSECNIF